MEFPIPLNRTQHPFVSSDTPSIKMELESSKPVATWVFGMDGVEDVDADADVYADEEALAPFVLEDRVGDL
jgi:hypothetical protein